MLHYHVYHTCYHYYDNSCYHYDNSQRRLQKYIPYTGYHYHDNSLRRIKQISRVYGIMHTSNCIIYPSIHPCIYIYIHPKKGQRIRSRNDPNSHPGAGAYPTRASKLFYVNSVYLTFRYSIRARISSPCVPKPLFYLPPCTPRFDAPSLSSLSLATELSSRPGAGALGSAPSVPLVCLCKGPYCFRPCVETHIYHIDSLSDSHRIHAECSPCVLKPPYCASVLFASILCLFALRVSMLHPRAEPI